MQALVGGRLFNADYQRRWLDSLRPEDPGKPDGQQYGYGIAQTRFGPNALYFHGGEMPGYNSFMGYDPVNRVTLVVWTNLTVSPDGKPTANSLMLKVLDQVYVESALRQAQASSRWSGIERHDAARPRQDRVTADLTAEDPTQALEGLASLAAGDDRQIPLKYGARRADSSARESLTACAGSSD